MTTDGSAKEEARFTSWLIGFQPGSRLRNLVIALVYVIVWPLGLVLLAVSLVQRWRADEGIASASDTDSTGQEPQPGDSTTERTQSTSPEYEPDTAYDGVKPLPMAEERQEMVYIVGSLFGPIPVLGWMVHMMMRIYGFCINIWYRIFELLGADSGIVNRFRADTEAILKNFNAGYRGEDQPETGT